jgi:hypothetical protein
LFFIYISFFKGSSKRKSRCMNCLLIIRQIIQYYPNMQDLLPNKHEKKWQTLENRKEGMKEESLEKRKEETMHASTVRTLRPFILCDSAV